MPKGLWISIVLVVAIFGFAAFLVVRMIQNRKKGASCCTGCTGCPYAASCQKERKPEKE